MPNQQFNIIHPSYTQYTKHQEHLMLYHDVYKGEILKMTHNWRLIKLHLDPNLSLPDTLHGLPL